MKRISDTQKHRMESLNQFIERMPAIRKPVSCGFDEFGMWWVKFSIDIHNELAWNVVQELAHIANCLSEKERLPVAFYPVSPPPYVEGGPSKSLSWIIQTEDKNFTEAIFKEWLEGRLPLPVEDTDQ